MDFKLKSDYEPKGDQPQAIRGLSRFDQEGKFRPNSSRSNRFRKNILDGEYHSKPTKACVDYFT